VCSLAAQNNEPSTFPCVFGIHFLSLNFVVLFEKKEERVEEGELTVSECAFQ